jgi:hypothetical protein
MTSEKIQRRGRGGKTTKYHYVRKRKTMPPSLGNEGENPVGEETDLTGFKTC